MRRSIVAIFALFLLPVCLSAQESVAHWERPNLSVLARWADAAPLDALPRPDTAALDRAIAAGDPAAIDRQANAIALRLARMHLLGNATAGERAGWNIEDSDRRIELEPMLADALAHGTLDTFFALLRPTDSEYSALRTGLARETDGDRRAAIARNMERWRWMPRRLGEDHVLVNAARFEANLWRNGARFASWRVIVGKQGTPTPVFDATIEGVTFNPWWEIPASIVRESVGALVRRNPSLARARGYVWSDGRYRQRPGPNNALGLMKLVMPNRFSVYMHDTPAKQLFDEEVRAFSHGCIRTGDAIGYAATLLEGTMTREEIDAILASGKTTTVRLAQPLPVYVAYFTAVSDGNGGISVLPDIYRRDQRIRVPAMEYAAQPGGTPLLAQAEAVPAAESCPLPDDPDVPG